MERSYLPRKQKDEILYHLPGWIVMLAEYFGKYAEKKRKTTTAGKLEKELNKYET